MEWASVHYNGENERYESADESANNDVRFWFVVDGLGRMDGAFSLNSSKVLSENTSDIPSQTKDLLDTLPNTSSIAQWEAAADQEFATNYPPVSAEFHREDLAEKLGAQDPPEDPRE